MRKLRLQVALSASLLLLMLSTYGVLASEHADGASRTLVLQRSVLSSGGGPGGTLSLFSNGTLGQSTPVGEGSSADNMLRTGFWAWRLATFSSLVDFPGRSARDYLLRNFPNPFSSSTTVQYVLAREGMAMVSVFNVRGRRVRTLVAENQGPGVHFAVWDGFDRTGHRVSPGIYFYRLDTCDCQSVRKMVLAK
jgi:hypothetical protein